MFDEMKDSHKSLDSCPLCKQSLMLWPFVAQNGLKCPNCSLRLEMPERVAAEQNSIQKIVENGGPFPATEVCSIVTEITEKLSLSHRNCRLHGHLTPDRIVVVISKHHKLNIYARFLPVFFGSPPFSIEVDDVDPVTISYFAPENFSAQSIRNQRTDVYSLGCIVYYMLSGHPPFNANSTPLRDLVPRILRGEMPKLPATVCSPLLSSIVSRATEKDPEARFSSMDEFRAAILGGA